MADKLHSLYTTPIDIGTALALGAGTRYAIQVIGGGDVRIAQAAAGGPVPSEGRIVYAGRGARSGDVLTPVLGETVYAWCPSGYARIAVWPAGS